jgi:hypothetical protein
MLRGYILGDRFDVADSSHIVPNLDGHLAQSAAILRERSRSRRLTGRERLNGVEPPPSRWIVCSCR